MFQIGAFSKLTQVSVRMLRYYDQMGLLKPARVDEQTGYRYYSASQLPTLNKIVFLRDLGFQVEEIRKGISLWERTGEIGPLLDNKQRQIEQTIQGEQERLDKLVLAKRDLLNKSVEMHSAVTIKSVPACHVLSLRRRVADYYREGTLHKELFAFIEENRVSVASEHTFTIYHDEDYREQDVDIELCVQVEVFGEAKKGAFAYRKVEAVPHMATTMVYGPFAHIAGAYRAFADWLSRHNRFEMLGESRQIVHRGPWNEAEPKHYLTELQIPLRKRGLEAEYIK